MNFKKKDYRFEDVIINLKGNFIITESFLFLTFIAYYNRVYHRYPLSKTYSYFIIFLMFFDLIAISNNFVTSLIFAGKYIIISGKSEHKIEEKEDSTLGF
jgi:hypothetical protein